MTIHPPLQIIYVGNGCEGFSSSVFIPAKSDQAVIEEIEPRQKYFLEFNEIYEPNQYIGLWYQFKIVLMNKSKAQKFVTRAKSVGTLGFCTVKQTHTVITHSERGRISGYPNDDSSRGGVYPDNHSWNPVCMQVKTGGACLFGLDFHSQGSVQTNTNLQVL